jgi:ribosome-associated protein
MQGEIPIRGEMIRLGQLLKLAGVVDAPETRRGRQLHPGDTVRVGTHELRLIAAS